MCFETTYSNKELIAEKDIFCWKYLQEDNYAPCWGTFLYKPKEVCKKVELRIIETRESDTGTGINEGYHSYKHFKLAPDWIRSDTKRKKFIIPKGTRYYENDTEYVSETIMLLN